MLHILKNSANLFKKKQEDILSAAFLISASAIISKLLGLIRLRLLASYFGGDIKLLDSLFAVSVFQDSIFEIFIFGSIALAFIPVFSKYLAGDKIEKAWTLASTMITIGFALFLIIAVVFLFFGNFLTPVLAPGLVSKFPESASVMARLLQIMLISEIFFVVSIFITGILQSFQRFLIPAIASIFYNIGIIISIIFLAPVFGIYAAAIGMIFGALLHLLIQLPLVFSLGYRFKLNLDFKNKDVREMISLMWPRTITIGLTRLSEIINIALASVAIVGSIVALNFAQVLQVAPTAFFAASISQAAFAFMSIEFNRGKIEEFKKIFIESLHQIIFLVLPIAAILAILRIPVVRLVFGAREFPWEITVLTGRTLIAFSLGITSQAVGLLLIRGFHAARDSYTPLKVSLGTVTLNIVLSLTFIFVFHMPVYWLALAVSITNITSSLVLMFLLNRIVGGFDKKALFIPFLKMITITLVMAVSLYIPMKLLDQLVFDTTRTIGLILLTTIASLVGMSVYILLSLIFNVSEVYIFAKFAKKVITYPKKIFTPLPITIVNAQEIKSKDSQ